MHPPAPQRVEGSLRASLLPAGPLALRREGRSWRVRGFFFARAGGARSAPRLRDTGKAGARRAAGSGRRRNL